MTLPEAKYAPTEVRATGLECQGVRVALRRGQLAWLSPGEIIPVTVWVAMTPAWRRFDATAATRTSVLIIGPVLR